MTQKELYAMRQAWMQDNIPYQFIHHTLFRYEILDNIMYMRRPGRKAKGQKTKSYNDVIIMFDTETSRKKLKTTQQISVLPSGLKARETHVCAWTISIRAFGYNIATLYGHKPSTMACCMNKIHQHMKGDITIFYAHNLPYDWWHCRRFIIKELGTPDKQLNIKPHYPLYIRFENGIELRDSLMIAQRKLEKWAEDLGAEHKKATGKWNYNKFRNQDHTFTKDELEYIEHDTLAGVECIDILKNQLGKHIYSIPFTATGIVRSEMQEIGKEHNAKDLFNNIAPTYEQYIKLTKLFHGGYTHANRHYIDVFIDILVQCYDFTSSYPFCMLVYKYQCEKFHSIKDRRPGEILHDADDYCFMFKLCAYKPKLKDPDHAMPALQYSKCVPGTCINPVMDNGRLLECDYCEIWLNEVDLSVLDEQYDLSSSICVECECAKKDYLPRWFTDFVFDLFRNKCITSLGNDPVQYSIDKSKVNCCYGMTVQKSVKENIIEDYETTDVTESYKLDTPEDEKERIKAEKKEYKKYLEKKNNILVYSWGCWVTSYAFKNVHELNKCVKDQNDPEKGGLLLYNDTDSAYAHGWDLDKLKAYNDNCIKLLEANGYGPIEIDGNTFILGIATHKPLKDDYTEFKVQGAIRYAGRCKKDDKIHITVAGVPKKGAESLNDNLHNFTKGHIFPGEQTGKKTHIYFASEIYIDKEGNETADSIDLLPCDYILDPTDQYALEELLSEDVEVEIYD